MKVHFDETVNAVIEKQNVELDGYNAISKTVTFNNDETNLKIVITQIDRIWTMKSPFSPFRDEIFTKSNLTTLLTRYMPYIFGGKVSMGSNYGEQLISWCTDVMKGAMGIALV